jgi:hypothetical protein
VREGGRGSVLREEREGEREREWGVKVLAVKSWHSEEITTGLSPATRPCPGIPLFFQHETASRGGRARGGPYINHLTRQIPLPFNPGEPLIAWNFEIESIIFRRAQQSNLPIFFFIALIPISDTQNIG